MCDMKSMTMMIDDDDDDDDDNDDDDNGNDCDDGCWFCSLASQGECFVPIPALQGCRRFGRIFIDISGLINSFGLAAVVVLE